MDSTFPWNLKESLVGTVNKSNAQVIFNGLLQDRVEASWWVVIIRVPFSETTSFVAAAILVVVGQQPTPGFMSLYLPLNPLSPPIYHFQSPVEVLVLFMCS